MILFPGEWCHSYYARDADQQLTMGPVGDNNNAVHAETGVVGIIMLPFCFDIWIITGSQQKQSRTGDVN